MRFFCIDKSSGACNYKGKGVFRDKNKSAVIPSPTNPVPIGLLDKKNEPTEQIEVQTDMTNPQSIFLFALRRLIS